MSGRLPVPPTCSSAPALAPPKLDDRYSLNPGMAGPERLHKNGNVAFVHGCGYAQPSFSHFTSMACWHTGSPNGGDAFGWMGRLADAMQPSPEPNFLINIAGSQIMAVRARLHTPVVFDQPERFVRNAFAEEAAALDRLAGQEASAQGSAEAMTNPSRAWLSDVTRGARQA